MTPQERQQVAELFDRLASLEGNRRDPDAERAIAEELRRAPNAVYALVQTVLVQDEALRDAHERLRQYEGDEQQPQQEGSFLDSMRDTFFGRRDQRGSVPSVRAPEQGASQGGAWQQGGGASPAWQRGAQEPQQGGGGSFLGTAAASAAGVIGGSLLLNSFRGMFGGGDHQSHSVIDASHERSPWGGNSSNSDLSRDAGVNDIGRGGDDNRHGLLDSAQAGDDSDDDMDSDFDGDDFDADFGGGSDSDFA